MKRYFIWMSHCLTGNRDSLIPFCVSSTRCTVTVKWQEMMSPRIFRRKDAFFKNPSCRYIKEGRVIKMNTFLLHFRSSFCVHASLELFCYQLNVWFPWFGHDISVSACQLHADSFMTLIRHSDINYHFDSLPFFLLERQRSSQLRFEMAFASFHKQS